MFIVETSNNLFMYYNYNSIITQINSSTSVINYLPCQHLFTFIFFLKLIFLNLIEAVNILLDVQITTNMKDALSIAIKFLVCIALLIFARGGIPRFRFDYLTKLG